MSMYFMLFSFINIYFISERMKEKKHTFTVFFFDNSIDIILAICYTSKVDGILKTCCSFPVPGDAFQVEIG